MQRVWISDAVAKIGKEVLLKGWVAGKRDLGKICFFDLRDKTGFVQVVGTKNIKELGNEDVVAITGLVKRRPDKLINPKIKTGTIEIEAKEIQIITKAKELPFPIDTEGYDLDEKLRLKCNKTGEADHEESARYKFSDCDVNIILSGYRCQCV